MFCTVFAKLRCLGPGCARRGKKLKIWVFFQKLCLLLRGKDMALGPCHRQEWWVGGPGMPATGAKGGGPLRPRPPGMRLDEGTLIETRGVGVSSSFPVY